MVDFDGRKSSKKEVLGLALLSFGGLFGLENIIDIARDISRNAEIHREDIIYLGILGATAYVGGRIYSKAMKKIEENNRLDYRKRQFEKFL